jgi:hypothetical protein
MVLALRLLINLPGFFGTGGGVLADQQALGVTEDGGQRVAQFMGDAAHHLSQTGKFFGLQQPGLENALSRKVAVDFNAPQAPSDGIQHRPRGSFEDARSGAHHLQFFAHASFDATRQFAPACLEAFRFGGLAGEVRDQSLKRFDFSGLPRIQAHNLFETRIDGPHVFVRVEQKDSFLQPLDDVLQFDFRMIGLPR